jgi:hypothetical protein
MSQYALDAKYVVENYQRNEKTGYGIDEINHQRRNSPRGGDDDTAMAVHPMTKVMTLFTKNYALFILVIILFIAMIKLDGYLADFAIIVAALGIFYFLGNRFIDIWHGKKEDQSRNM